MTDEDEAFNEIEKRSKVKQDILMHPSKEAQLIAEVAVLTEMVRVLSDKVNELEKQNGVPVGVGGWLTTTSKQELGEPVAWEQFHGHMAGPFYQAPQQRTWVGLSDEEAQWLYDNCRTPSNLIDMTEAKLKEKNTSN